MKKKTPEEEAVDKLLEVISKPVSDWKINQELTDMRTSEKVIVEHDLATVVDLIKPFCLYGLGRYYALLLEEELYLVELCPRSNKRTVSSPSYLQVFAYTIHDRELFKKSFPNWKSFETVGIRFDTIGTKYSGYSLTICPKQYSK